jgi:hypothetical protein
MIRRHLTPSLIISLLALFIATSGASYAALKIPKNSVGTKQLKTSAVTTKKVKDGSLRAKDFMSGQLPAGPAGPTGPAGPSDAYRADRSGPLLALTNALQPVVSTQTLPAGSYVLFARSNVIAGSAGGTVLCSIANDAAQNITLTGNGVLALNQTATTTLDAPGTVTLSCLEQAGNLQVAQASITAVKVESLTYQ